MIINTKFITDFDQDFTEFLKDLIIDVEDTKTFSYRYYINDQPTEGIMTIITVHFTDYRTVMFTMITIGTDETTPESVKMDTIYYDRYLDEFTVKPCENMYYFKSKDKR